MKISERRFKLKECLDTFDRQTFDAVEGTHWFIRDELIASNEKLLLEIGE